MAIDSKDLRAFAEAAVDVQNPSEVELRASISRAYYSCFHEVLPFVAKLPPSSRFRASARHITHEDLYHRLLEWKVESVCASLKPLTVVKSQLCRVVDATRMMRVKADYAVSEEITLADAKMQLERAKRVSRHMLQVFEEMERAAA